MARNVYNVDETLKQEFNFKHLKRLFGYLKPHRKETPFCAVFDDYGKLGQYHHPASGQGNDRSCNSRTRRSEADLDVRVAFAAVIVISAIRLKKRILTVNQLGQTIIETMRKDLFVHSAEAAVFLL